MRRRALLLSGCALAMASGAPKKKKEELTQTLPMLRELPQAVAANPRRLAFHVTPLTGKGLLSQQIREALKAVGRVAGDAPVIQLRAFVAGSGDLRRVRDLVSATFTDHRQPLPVLTLVQAGGLPLVGAQIAIEAVTLAKKELNPRGLAFFSAQAAYADDPLAPVPPLAEKARAGLREALRAAGLEGADVVRLTCYLSSLDGLESVRRAVAAEFPSAAAVFLQTSRGPDRGVAALEAVARLRQAPAQPVTLVGPDTAAGESRAALIGAPQVVLTGSQVAFGFKPSDAVLAFERLGRSLEQAGTSLADTVYAHYYPLSPGMAAQVRKVRSPYFRAEAPPASTMTVVEGLPAIDAGFAMDVVAVKR